MNSYKSFDEKMNLSRTEIMKLLTEAKESIITIKFNIKVGEDNGKESLKYIYSKIKLNDDKF